MTVSINNIEVSPESLAVNDGLNYGRFFNKETQVYKIQLSKKELLNLIEKEYNKIRYEIKADDEQHNDTSDFTNTKYCSLQELIAFESDFESIVKTYLDSTLLKKLFYTSTKNCYTINSTDSVKIVEDTIIIKGRVFKTNSLEQ